MYVGEALTYKIVTKQHKVIYPSAIHSALDLAKRNQSLSPLGGETVSTYIGDTIFVLSKSPSESHTDTVDGDPNLKKCMVTIDPKYLIGRTFLKETDNDDQRFRACVVHTIIDKDDELKKGSEYIKFICKVPSSTVVFTYNEILDQIEKENNDIESDTNELFKFVALLLIKVPFANRTRIGKDHQTMC
jgi:hypothetical protein